MKTLFITATDTGIGKTITTLVLATLLQAKGYKVGVMKPVQCAGTDIQLLTKSLKLKEDRAVLNPYFAPEPLSPHLALKRAKIKFNLRKIKKAIKKFKKKYDILLLEGAGGLMVPITDDYFTADLIRDLDADVVIVSRLGLGTINHTLLTINQAKANGLNIRGLIFSDSKGGKKTLPEKTNPDEIQKLSGIRVLGTIPLLKSFTESNILKTCAHLKLPV
jgi:dethiobiotin synthetase